MSLDIVLNKDLRVKFKDIVPGSFFVLQNVVYRKLLSQTMDYYEVMHMESGELSKFQDDDYLVSPASFKLVQK